MSCETDAPHLFSVQRELEWQVTRGQSVVHLTGPQKFLSHKPTRPKGISALVRIAGSVQNRSYILLSLRRRPAIPDLHSCFVAIASLE